jgi:signal transduction histidine kinase
VKRESVRYWQRIFIGNIIASAVVLFAFSGATFATPPAQVVRAFGIAMLFSTCIAPLLGFAMPRIAPRIWRHTKFPWNWIAVSVVMVMLAMVGSVLAIATLVAIGFVPAHRFGDWLQDSARISIVLTLTIGLFITAYEVMRARLAQTTAQAQLAALESRVQPHFLFNTLNSIAALIHEDPKGAERMTGQLAALLRSSLDHQATPLVRLEDELQIVRDYLSIEHVRFGDRLRFEIQSDATADARVPRLALQTLVENSVKYAVSPRKDGASIAIRAVKNRATPPNIATTTIAVEDDGPGFDATVLPEGHGLALLRARLALLFGDRGELRIDSTPQRTIVAFSVPETHDEPSPVRMERNWAYDPRLAGSEPRSADAK